MKEKMKKSLKIIALLCAVCIMGAFVMACSDESVNLKIVEDTAVFETENYGMAIRQDNEEFVNAVNAVLDQMMARGYIDAISTIYGGSLDATVEPGQFVVDPVEFSGETVAEGFLTMGTNASFPPFEFIADDDAAGSVDGVDGIDVAIARVIARALGLELRVSDMEFTAIIPSIQTGQVDIGIAGMTITDERRENVDFTRAYYTAAQVMIVGQDSEVTSAADLAGLRVGVVIGYTGDLRITYLHDEGEIVVGDIVRLRSGVDLILELEAGRIDAVIIDRATAEALIASR
jgi:ABC-type amino acid transport substrate-binding protein